MPFHKKSPCNNFLVRRSGLNIFQAKYFFVRSIFFVFIAPLGRGSRTIHFTNSNSNSVDQPQRSAVIFVNNILFTFWLENVVKYYIITCHGS